MQSAWQNEVRRESIKLDSSVSTNIVNPQKIRLCKHFQYILWKSTELDS